MSEKRFECVFVEEGFGGTYRRLRDNETGIVHMTCDVADLLNFQNTQIKCLKEENEQLKAKADTLTKWAKNLEKRLRLANDDNATLKLKINGLGDDY